MKSFVFLIATMALAACGGSSDPAENSQLGSVEVRTGMPRDFLPSISKVEILALAKGESDQSKATVFTLPSLNSTDQAMMLAAGEYEFGVKVYQKIGEQDVVLAQSIKASSDCPFVNGTIKGGSKTQINLAVCMNDVTKPLGTNGTGSGSFAVEVRGFLPLLKCVTASNYGTYKNNFVSVGIDTRLDANNKAAAFRLVLGQKDAAGVTEHYYAPLKFVALSSRGLGMDTEFQVQSQTGEKIGSIFFSSEGSLAWSYQLLLNDGNGVTHLGNVAASEACSQVVNKPDSFSLYSFFRGE